MHRFNHGHPPSVDSEVMKPLLAATSMGLLGPKTDYESKHNDESSFEGLTMRRSYTMATIFGQITGRCYGTLRA